MKGRKIDSWVNWERGADERKYFTDPMQTSVLCFPQGEEAVFLSACTCHHGEWRLVLYFAREVKPSGRAGAEPF